MKTLSRILIGLLALSGVSALGYYAYILTATTLTFPFLGMENQKGNMLEFVVSPPRLFAHQTAIVLDPDAVRSSLKYGDGPLIGNSTVSGEYTIEVAWGYVRVSGDAIVKKNAKSITLSADEYNNKKTTPYRLPRDIVLTPSDIPRDISVSSVGESRDQKYDISMYGFDEYNPDNIRYYVHYESGATCDISSSWGTDMLPPYYERMPQKWDSPLTPVVPTVMPPRGNEWIPRWPFVQLSATSIHPSMKDGQVWTSQIQLPYNLDAPRLCIIAGVGGVFRTIENRTLDPFTVTWATLDTLSPEYDMKSQVEFRFSHSLYQDQWTLYSPEYIAHRSAAKIDFLKHLDVSPHIDITPDDLILTPDRAILTLPLKEGEKYNFSIKDITDVYGRKVSINHEVLPKSSPFLSIRLDGNQAIFKKNSVIPLKLYSLKAEKNTYSLKLCRINLEWYAEFERMILDPDHSSNDMMYSLFEGSGTSNCVKKDITLTQTGYISPFFAEDFNSGRPLNSWMYVLAFSNKSDIASLGKLYRPMIFSVIDSHITLKVDASGKILALVTDISTWAPLADQEIVVRRNVSRTYSEKRNPDTGQSEKTYLPLSTQAFATGIVLGRTNSLWMLETKVDTLKGNDGYDSSPYGLSFEDWWNYEGRYDSFLLQSWSSDRFGYVVSTWNDGITGYNFGIKDSDYSGDSKSLYTAYLHTDRRLYLPGEKVYIHAIIRQNEKSLTVPRDTPFDLVVNDPTGREVKRTTVMTNDFWSLSVDLDLAKDAPLGSYSMSIISTKNSEYIENGWGNFQVEVFKNPTFTATVTLKSPDVEGEIIRNLRKVENTDPYTPWYKDVYTGNFSIDWIVKAKYYNGAEMKNTSFTYRIYRSEYYGDDYWSDCFWWCYYEPPIEFYTEGTGTIDSDGYGTFRVPVDYSSYYSDYKYTAEIIIRDALSGEEVTTPGTLLVRLPEEYKAFAPENPLLFAPKKKILSATDTLAWEIKPEYGKWSTSLIGKYRYEIIEREYVEGFVDDIRAGSLRITTPTDHIIASGAVVSKDFSYKMIGAKAGEYHIRVLPLVSSGEPPESSISDTIFYISGDLSSLRDNTLRVIPEKTIYKLWETAKVLIQVPFTGSHLLITKEKWWVIDKEYVYLTGNTLTREIPIDDTIMPNAYIGVVALNANPTGNSRSYAVWYGEIITDIADKKSILTVAPDKTTYKNRENVNVDLTLTDRSGNPLQWEVTLMVVDESLIRLLGNIDLDIIPKFYQKFPFTVKTSLSAIGIERNRFLSRKGSNGWSGDKWGGGIEIASRILFKNTAYYNPSIRTDISGKARVNFALPDNITDYRIIAISNTQDSRFGVAEKTIEVRKDYVVEVHVPTILRNGDTFTLTASAFNNTKRITPIDVILTLGTGATKITKQSSLSLDIMEAKSVDFSISVPASWKDAVSYSVELREKWKLLDGITSSIRIPEFPFVGKISRKIELFTGTTFTSKIPKITEENIDSTISPVSISLSTSYASELGNAIASLLSYPYGCIEQTISSTLPNMVALSLSESIGTIIDRQKALLNIKVGLEKILRMQHYSGWWVYWEGSNEPHAAITPYVLRSLLVFRELGQIVPDEAIVNGTNYIINNESTYSLDPNMYAEATWTLANVKNEQAAEWWKRIDPNKLNRHGYLAYAYAAEKLSRSTPQILKNLEKIMTTESDDYWYWNLHADKSLYVQFLFDRGEIDKALPLLDSLVRETDMNSYYVSTQEKIQLFLTIAREARLRGKISTPLAIALRSDGLIADVSLTSDKPYSSIVSSRSKVGESFTLKRDKDTPPIYVMTRTEDRPKDILLMKAYSTGGLNMTRTFELIDESRWVDSGGKFLVATPVKDSIFQKWKLYRVNLAVNLPNYENKSWYNLALEDYFPAGWRPINGIFHTESALTHEESDNWWDYIESRDDRLLSHISYGYGKMRNYSYYIRPEYVGEYLLPPATAYFMYRPEYHSYTQYQKIKVIP